LISINDDYVNKKEMFKKYGIKVPYFDQETIKKKTYKNPTWIHFGGGNIFRAFQANLAQELINLGKLDTGIIVAESYDEEIIELAYKPYQNRALKVILDTAGNFDKELIASVTEALFISKNIDRMIEIFENPSLQIATFSITEKGYLNISSDGSFLPIITEGMVASDTINFALKSDNIILQVTALLYKRFQAGKLKMALMSNDNFFQNSHKLRMSILDIAKSWEENSLIDKGFCDYLSDDYIVSFPHSMIDKIVPAQAEIVSHSLKLSGFKEYEVINTNKRSITGAFVNAELIRYLVIEDNFPNGRPAFDDLTGVYMTTRDIVSKSERMKVCACLNPIHTAIGALGCLLEIDWIYKIMQDLALLKLARGVGYIEGLPVAEDAEIINPKEFLDEVINSRLTNQYIPDSSERMTVDESTMLAIRFGVTINEYIKRPELDENSLKFIPFAIAGWFRYLVGETDSGQPMVLSPDPNGAQIAEIFKNMKVGEPVNQELIKEVLSNESVFGFKSDVISDKITEYFVQMMQGYGAVRKTLNNVVK
jgi:fructuronate reductase